MERKNRLAVFEHVPHKEKSAKNIEARNSKRTRSPETTFEDNTSGNIKKRRNCFIWSKEPFMVVCDYSNCDEMFEDYMAFLKHIKKHWEELDTTIEDHLNCKWLNCDYVATDIICLKQHLHYHGYHTKLKSIGQNLLDKLKLPACILTDEFKICNQLITYTCEWESCDVNFIEYQYFLDHVKCHVNTNPKTIVLKTDIIKCGWTCCSNTYPTMYKLLDHVKTHTKEKVAACPTCGFAFASNTKFIDHRKKQMPRDMQSYQCSQCSKQFPSERLLRDHMRVHINHYKCHLCDMTCTKPSSLAKHIRYRHLPDRPFTCDICNHSTITNQDLQAHKKTHSEDNPLQCPECDYNCRSKYTFERHRNLVHKNGTEQKYVCHCCQETFIRGALLTKHLIKVHDFHWPSGHSRFLYKQDPKTGLYHLQVVRYESLEVTQEMIQGNVPFQHEVVQDCKYEVEHSSDNPFTYTLKLATNMEEKIENEEKVVEDTDGKAFKFCKIESKDNKKENAMFGSSDPLMISDFSEEES